MRQRATMPAALPTSREEALKPTRSRPTTRLQGSSSIPVSTHCTALWSQGRVLGLDKVEGGGRSGALRRFGAATAAAPACRADSCAGGPEGLPDPLRTHMCTPCPTGTGSIRGPHASEGSHYRYHHWRQGCAAAYHRLGMH